VFILATTELEKVPDTVQSRCQVFTFKKPTAKVVDEMVAKVAKAEGFSLEKASSELIALLAGGSFRDALSILQKIIASSSDNKVSIEEVEMVTGAPRGELVARVIRALAKGEAQDALAAVGEATRANADMELFAAILLDRVRLLLLLRYSPEFGATLIEDLTDADREALEEMAQDADSKINSETLRKLIEASISASRSPMPHLPLELAIIELASIDS
jgi:DNA polymerase-3 subunit gamma/tau